MPVLDHVIPTADGDCAATGAPARRRPGSVARDDPVPGRGRGPGHDARHGRPARRHRRGLRRAAARRLPPHAGLGALRHGHRVLRRGRACPAHGHGQERDRRDVPRRRRRLAGLPVRGTRDVRRHRRHHRVLHGRASLIVAAHRPDRIAATASFHGGGLASAQDPDSPHLRAGDIRSTVYVAGATDDASFDDAARDRLETALTEAGVPHTIETYPAAHGFAVPDNPTFDEAAAERHWAALESFYAGTLPRT